jgi:hypothetical protein
MNQFYMRKLLLASVAFILVLSACKKTDDLGQSRLFRPVNKEPLVSEGNWVLASWQAIKGAQNYTVQISKDTFKTILVSRTIDTSAYLFENLEWNRRYQVQVKANSADSGFSSRMSYLGEVKTPAFPSILNVPTISEISDNAVKVSWTTSGAAVTSIRIIKTADSSMVAQATLSPTDINNKYRIVSGLSQLTPYTIFLYSGTTVRGWADFTTKATLAGSIIDLREITGRPSVLSDTIPIIASGSIILLKRGETYNISSTLNLNKSLTFLSGNDLLNPDQAIISLPSNFNITSGSVIDSIVFRDVYLQGTDYASKYVFNINTACTIGKISFESCRAEYFRGVLRTQSQPAIITNFNIDNCIMDSIAGYGIITVDVTSSRVDNISIRNSTIYKAEKIVTSRNNSNSVTIENCTFNEAPRGGNYYIDYSTSPTNNVAQPIVFKNNILGVGKSNAGNVDVRGYRVGSGTSIDVSNTYATSDFLSTTVANQFPNLIVYPKLSTEIWQDPYNGNFKIIDNAFPGKSSAGDPRWRL